MPINCMRNIYISVIYACKKSQRLDMTVAKKQGGNKDNEV